jgi:hypothetical protein
MVALLPARTAALRHGELAAQEALGPQVFGELTWFGAALDYASAVAHALA